MFFLLVYADFRVRTQAQDLEPAGMRRDIVVIGGSAGGLEALIAILGGLPADVSAALFVVIHIPATSVSVLPRIVSRETPLQAVHPEDNELIRHGVVYVAPPNRHLVIAGDKIRLVHGPRENGHRPAADPLFRSAAADYGPRVIGIVVSGNLNDGSAGLLAIKRMGGITMVQDPSTALHRGMPLSASRAAQPDIVAPAEELGRAVARHVSQPSTEPETFVSGEAGREARIAELFPEELHSDANPGSPSGFSCPECSGGLWEVEDGEMTRFRCRVGHAYTMETFVSENGRSLENAFWVALRALEESASLARRVTKRAEGAGNLVTAARFREREQRLVEQAEQIRSTLLNGSLDEDAAAGIADPQT
jgi:two-component system, chemotaxis family, protein-glutamate methylesterase/glutaminase